MRPPPLRHLLYYPVTAHVAAASLSLSLAKFAGVDLSFLYTDYHTWPGQPWRLVTSTLLHVNALHLILNLSMIWAFSTIVEDKLGALRTIALYLVLAFGSSAAEYAFFDGGIGLSGIGFGLFAMLWLLNRRDPRFAKPEDVIDRQTASWLVFWFFLCIVLTIANVMPVANVAHGAGALLGYMIAWAISARTHALRLRWWAALVAVLALFTAASWWGRPYVNLSPRRGVDLFIAGTEALEGKRPEDAEKLLRQAIRMNPHQSVFWHNLGVTYVRLGRESEARAAFDREKQLKNGQLERGDNGEN